MIDGLDDSESPHCHDLCEAMYRCVENDQFCDTIIYTSTRPVYAHAVVLANVSKELQLLVNTVMDDNENANGMRYELDLTSAGCTADGDVITSLLQYCYTGLLGSMNEESIKSLYIASQYLGIEPVSAMCLDYVKNMKKMSKKKPKRKTKEKSTFIEVSVEDLPTLSEIDQVESGDVVDDVKIDAVTIKQEIPDDESKDDMTTHLDIISMEEADDEDLMNVTEALKSEPVSMEIGDLDTALADSDVSQMTFSRGRGGRRRRNPAARPLGVQCPKCPKCFVSQSELMRHYLPVHEDYRFKCEMPGCDKSFKYKTGLTAHEQEHTGEYKYECSICKEGFTRKHNLDRHMKLKHNQKPTGTIVPRSDPLTDYERRKKFRNLPPPGTAYKCPFMCNTECPSKDELEGHLLDAHIDDWDGETDTLDRMLKNAEKVVRVAPKRLLYKCKQCPKRFATQDALERHIGPMHEGKNWVCEVCNEQFVRKTLLNAHMQEHTGEYSYRCQYCNMGFSRKFRLNRHIGTQHMKKSCQCERCGKSFDYKLLVYNHQKTCGVETNKYECKICHKFLKSDTLLRCHMYLHDPSKATPCSHCGKVFKSRKNARLHELKVHPAVPAVECPICHAMVKNEIYLKRHILLHDPKQAAPCRFCGKVFKGKAHARLHEKKMHLNVGRFRKKFARKPLTNEIMIKPDGQNEISFVKQVTLQELQDGQFVEGITQDGTTIAIAQDGTAYSGDVAIHQQGATYAVAVPQEGAAYTEIAIKQNDTVYNVAIPQDSAGGYTQVAIPQNSTTAYGPVSIAQEGTAYSEIAIREDGSAYSGVALPQSATAYSDMTAGANDQVQEIVFYVTDVPDEAQ